MDRLEFADATATPFYGIDDGMAPLTTRSSARRRERSSGGRAGKLAAAPKEYTLFGSSAGDADRPTLRVVVANRNVHWLPSGADGQVITWNAVAPADGIWFDGGLRRRLRQRCCNPF